MKNSAQAKLQTSGQSEAAPADAPRKSRELSGFTLATIANVLWGTSFLASKYTLLAWGPFTASALRFAIALFVMALILPRMGYSLRLPRSKTAITNLSIVGITGFGLLYPLQLAGLAKISSGLSAAIMLTSPLFVVVLSSFVLKESVSARKIVALILGVVGGSLLLHMGFPSTELGSGIWSGSLLTLAASLSLALSVIATRNASSELSSASLTFWSMLVGLMFLIPFSVNESLSAGLRVPSPSSLIALFYLAAVCSALCFLIWNRAISRSSPSELATTMHIKTPTAVILGIAVVGESVSIQMIVGTIIVATGIYLSQSGKKKEIK